MERSDATPRTSASDPPVPPACRMCLDLVGIVRDVVEIQDRHRAQIARLERLLEDVGAQLEHVLSLLQSMKRAEDKAGSPPASLASESGTQTKVVLHKLTACFSEVLLQLAADVTARATPIESVPAGESAVAPKAAAGTIMESSKAARQIDLTGRHTGADQEFRTGEKRIRLQQDGSPHPPVKRLRVSTPRSGQLELGSRALEQLRRFLHTYSEEVESSPVVSRRVGAQTSDSSPPIPPAASSSEPTTASANELTQYIHLPTDLKAKFFLSRQDPNTDLASVCVGILKCLCCGAGLNKSGRDGLMVCKRNQKGQCRRYHQLFTGDKALRALRRLWKCHKPSGADVPEQLTAWRTAGKKGFKIIFINEDEQRSLMVELIGGEKAEESLDS